MRAEVSSREGLIEFRGHNVWYRIAGDSEGPGKLPLLCLHGGPGAPHDYLEPLEEMAAEGRRVIFYDQLGCGNSDQPHDPSMWTVDLFVEEVGVVRRALGLERVHILGQSWGGMLAMEYALTQPEGLASLIVADSPARSLSGSPKRGACERSCRPRCSRHFRSTKKPARRMIPSIRRRRLCSTPAMSVSWTHGPSV